MGAKQMDGWVLKVLFTKIIEKRKKIYADDGKYNKNRGDSSRAHNV